MLAPGTTIVGPVLVTARSAENPVFALTVVVTLARLLPGLGSFSGAAAVTLFVIVPAPFGVTRMVRVVLAPEARVATKQVTTPFARLQPALALSKVTAPGRRSETRMLVAALGPRLVTVMV